jgi:hypothetical protein
MMTKNRRFPFERTNEEISLENFSTTEEQLYPIIRQYASICRHNNHEKPQPTQQTIISNQENDRLYQLMNHLKQECEQNFVDINDFSALRKHHIQHWKNVKYQWQKYYRDEMKKQQEIFENIRKISRR